MSQIDVGASVAFTAAGISLPPVLATVAAAPDLRLFTVDEYHRLGDSGVLGGNERLELLEGVITMMTPIGIAHARSVVAIQSVFQSLLPAGWQAISQQPLGLVDSEPIPDCYVLRGDFRTFTRLPNGSEIAIAVEVADSSLKQDRETKARVYAAAGIPEYWIINLAERKLEVHRQSAAAFGQLPARYESLDVFGPEQTLDVVLDGTKVGTISVGDVLP
jgi:Uma2 family endonuclease